MNMKNVIMIVKNALLIDYISLEKQCSFVCTEHNKIASLFNNNAFSSF